MESMRPGKHMLEQNRKNGKPATAVIGIGNILLKDDGAGIHVINALKERTLPAHIKLVDGGTSTLDMLDYFSDYDALVIIDVLRGGKKAGTLYKLAPEEMAGFTRENLSLHDVQILEVIEMARLLGDCPEVIIYGIEPGEITYGTEMSAELQAALPHLVDCIYRELT